MFIIKMYTTPCIPYGCYTGLCGYAGLGVDMFKNVCNFPLSWAIFAEVTGHITFEKKYYGCHGI